MRKASGPYIWILIAVIDCAPIARDREWLLYHEFKVGDGLKAEIQNHDQSSMDSDKHSDLSSNLPGCLRLFSYFIISNVFKTRISSALFRNNPFPH